MKEINKLKIINQLKSVYRANSVENRKESSAEHSWSCLLLADFFMPKSINKLRVHELLMYHDLVEIETGDVPLLSEETKEDEFEAAKKLKSTLPKKIADKFWGCFIEFEEKKTLEAKFAKAIDSLDPVIHELDQKEDWKGFKAEFIIEKKLKNFEDFPELKKTFLTIIKHMQDEGYIK